MANKKTARRALVMSVLSLILCCSMLVGTTFAWFTDSVTSTSNIIKSGTLDAEMYYSNDASTWNDASTGAIFTHAHWEPGYTEAKYIKIVNKGNLAFKFQLNILPDVDPAAGATNLAEVIDVYMIPGVDPLTDRSAVSDTYRVGTLASLMAETDGAAHGVILPKDGATVVVAPTETVETETAAYTIVLKMQESAGNEYQNLSVGNGFSVQLLATQYTWEKDSFDEKYDDGAEYNAAPAVNAPVANVSYKGAQKISATAGMGGDAEDIELDTSFIFKTTETAEEAKAGDYRYWHADFVVKTDKDVAAEAITLAGYYAAYCEDYNHGNWVALTSDEVIAANTEIRLLSAMLSGGSINYGELCEWIPEFQCGATGTDSAVGTTLTVELRLYETEEPSAENGNSHNEETGKYIVVGEYSYTF